MVWKNDRLVYFHMQFAQFTRFSLNVNGFPQKTESLMIGYR